MWDLLPSFCGFAAGARAIASVAKHKQASTFSGEQSDRQLSAGASRRTRQ